MGIRTENVVALDFEDYEMGRDFVATECRGVTIALSRTRRGIHVLLRNPGTPVPNAVKVKAGPWVYDLRGNRGFVVAPPTVVGGHEYH